VGDCHPRRELAPIAVCGLSCAVLVMASRKTPKIDQSDCRFGTAREKEDEGTKLRASVFMETFRGKATVSAFGESRRNRLQDMRR